MTTWSWNSKNDFSSFCPSEIIIIIYVIFLFVKFSKNEYDPKKTKALHSNKVKILFFKLIAKFTGKKCLKLFFIVAIRNKKQKRINSLLNNK